MIVRLKGFNAMGENKHSIVHEELPHEHVDPLIAFLHQTIRFAIRVLAVMMVMII